MPGAAFTIGKLPDHTSRDCGGPGPIGIPKWRASIGLCLKGLHPVSRFRTLSITPFTTLQAGATTSSQRIFPPRRSGVLRLPAQQRAGLRTGRCFHDIPRVHGQTYIVEQEEPSKKRRSSTEGIDTCPRCRGSASLLQAVESGRGRQGRLILLKSAVAYRLKADLETRVVEPWLRVPKPPASTPFSKIPAMNHLRSGAGQRRCSLGWLRRNGQGHGLKQSAESRSRSHGEVIDCTAPATTSTCAPSPRPLRAFLGSGKSVLAVMKQHSRSLFITTSSA